MSGGVGGFNVNVLHGLFFFFLSSKDMVWVWLFRLEHGESSKYGLHVAEETHAWDHLSPLVSPVLVHNPPSLVIQAAEELLDQWLMVGEG